jgi:5-methylcytosine-specific restriction enzyme A
MSKACLVFGCGLPVVARGRCQRHGAQVDAQRSVGADRQVGKKLYNSAKWKALRKVLLAASPFCRCAECVAGNHLRMAGVVHHLEPHGGDVGKFFNPSNLMPMAKACHDRLTATGGGKMLQGCESLKTASSSRVSLRRSDLGPLCDQGGGDRG